MSAIYCSRGCGRFWLHSPTLLCDPCHLAERARQARVRARAVRAPRKARPTRRRRAKVVRLPPERRSRGIPRAAYLPLAPLLALVGGDQSELALLVGVTRRTVVRWVARGSVSAIHADAIAVACGYHPAELWGMSWLTLAA